MIFGKRINKYYIKYAFILIIGIIALVAVDYYQLRIPEIYGTIIDGLDPTTPAVINKEMLGKLCIDLLIIILILVVGRVLWRMCFYGTAIKVETELRKEMFDHCKDLSQEFYQTNKVGHMMSLFTKISAFSSIVRFFLNSGVA